MIMGRNKKSDKFANQTTLFLSISLVVGSVKGNEDIFLIAAALATSQLNFLVLISVTVHFFDEYHLSLLSILYRVVYSNSFTTVMTNVISNYSSQSMH